MEPGVKTINSVPIELTVVLGRATLPIHQLLKMGRGAVIELDRSEGDAVQILANDRPIAEGDVVVQGDRIGVSLTAKLRRKDIRP
jgi:flagellar motor switch protein FliN/FliY